MGPEPFVVGRVPADVWARFCPTPWSTLNAPSPELPPQPYPLIHITIASSTSTARRTPLGDLTNASGVIVMSPVAKNRPKQVEFGPGVVELA